MRIAALTSTALVVFLVSCTDDTCSVSETADGTVQIQCSGDPIEVESCFASLPDLDGNGAVDAADCALSGVGASHRALCADSDAWWTLPACRAAETAAIRVAFGVNDAVSMSWNGLRHVFGTSANFSVWTDSDDDGRYDQSEDHVISAVTGIIGVEQVDQMTVVGWGGPYAIVWRDANQDGLPDPAEVSALQLLPAGEQLEKLAVFFRATTPATYALAFRKQGSNPAPRVRAWSDLDADGQVDAAEIIDISADFGSLVDAYNYAVHIDEGATRRVWTPAPEMWSTGSGTTQAATSAESRCADFMHAGGVSFCVERASLGGDLKRLNGDGTATSLPLAAETVDDFSGHAIAVRDLSTGRPRSVIWDDADFSDYPDEGELRAVAGRVAYDAFRDRLYSFGPADATAYAVETWHARDVTRFLGETCDAGEACAGTLTCRISGNAPEPRCVPPLP